MKKTVITSFRATPKTLAQLRKIQAHKGDISMASAIAIAVDAYVKVHFWWRNDEQDDKPDDKPNNR